MLGRPQRHLHCSVHLLLFDKRIGKKAKGEVKTKLEVGMINSKKITASDF